MKTAVSIPDDVFERAVRAADELGISRSELYARSLREFVGARRDQDITRSYDEAFADVADDEVDALRRKAARRTLLDVEWNEA